MKTKVWKLYFFTDDSAETPRYIYDQVEILGERDLRERFKQAINDGQFNDGTFERFDLSDPNAFSCDEIAEIFAYDGYEIQEIEINF